MENETDEQFEERVLNKRAAQMFVAVRSKMQKHDTIYLSEMTYRNNRKQVCSRFNFFINFHHIFFFIEILLIFIFCNFISRPLKNSTHCWC